MGVHNADASFNLAETPPPLARALVCTSERNREGGRNGGEGERKRKREERGERALYE